MSRRKLRRSRIRLAELLFTALLASSMAPVGIAHAESADDQRVETYVRPVNAEPLTLDEVQGTTRSDRLRATQSDQEPQTLLPHETVGPAASYAPRAPEESQQPAPTKRNVRPRAAEALSLPEPSHTMTRQECVKALGTQVFYVKSRFAVCTGKQFDQVWLRNGQPVGTSHFDVLAIGTIPKNSRVMTVTYHFTDFTTERETGAPAMGITTKGSISKSWPSTAQYTQGGAAMPTTRTWAALQAADTLTHTVTTAPGQGSGTRDSVFAVYTPSISLKAPTTWTTEPITGGDLFMLPPRWEKSSYLPNTASGAAVFSVISPLRYSKAATAPEREVALHIEKAFTKPGTTQPPSSKKNVPGQKADAPLTRLYHDETRRKQNRNRSVYNCTKYFGPNYTQNGTKECDEYPFASTYEGSAWSDNDPLAEPNNFSVLPVLKDNNRDAGILLGQYYDKNRIIDGPDDGFIVQIVP